MSGITVRRSMAETGATARLGVVAIAAAGLVLSACGSNDGNVNRVAELEKTLGDATLPEDTEDVNGDGKKDFADVIAAEEMRDAREGAARRTYFGLTSGRYLSGRTGYSFSMAEDDSTLTISPTNPEENGPDNILSRSDDAPANLGDWTGVRFSGAWTTEDGSESGNDMAVIYRTELQNGYLYFGWWERGTTGSSDMPSPHVKSFAASLSGSSLGPVDDISGMTGTATYTGKAAGRYGIVSLLGGTVDSGEFTANATLNADFGAGTISGMIDGFDVQDGWTVKLYETAITAGAANFRKSSTDFGARPADGTGAEWTIPGARVRPDVYESTWWAGSFVGSDAEGLRGAFYTKIPHVGRMTGAFGAVQQ